MLLVAYIQINNSVFLSSPLMSVVLRDTARIGMISVGIVLVMITGEIDLSVGAIFAMAPYLMIRMSTDWGGRSGCRRPSLSCSVSASGSSTDSSPSNCASQR